MLKELIAGNVCSLCNILTRVVTGMDRSKKTCHEIRGNQAVIVLDSPVLRMSDDVLVV